METKVKCALTIPEWSTIMHLIQKEAERLSDGGFVANDKDTLFAKLAVQLNNPEIVTVTVDPPIKVDSEFAGGMENFHCNPSPEPAAQETEQEEPKQEVVVIKPTERDSAGNVVPPPINLPGS